MFAAHCKLRMRIGRVEINTVARAQEIFFVVDDYAQFTFENEVELLPAVNDELGCVGRRDVHQHRTHRFVFEIPS